MPDEDFGFELDLEEELPLMTPEVLPPAVSASRNLDITPIALSLVPYEQMVAALTVEARAIKIVDAESEAWAVEVEGKNKKIDNLLEQERTRVRAPYLAHLSTIQNIFKALQDKVKANVVLLKNVRKPFENMKEMERRQREAQLREEQRRRQAELDEQARLQREQAQRKIDEAEAEKTRLAEAGKLDEAALIGLQKTIDEEQEAMEATTPVAPKVTMEQPAVIRAGGASSYTKFVWRCTIIDPELVPRAYCEPVQKLLNAAVKGGVRNIAGCLIEELPELVTKI